MPELTLILLVAAIFALVLIPTRRLFTAGWSSRPLAVYLAGLLGLALLIALTRGRVGFLLPILVLAYIAPFITARRGVRTIRDRVAASIKNVTPSEDYAGSPPRDPRSPPSGSS